MYHERVRNCKEDYEKSMKTRKEKKTFKNVNNRYTIALKSMEIRKSKVCPLHWMSIKSYGGEGCKEVTIIRFNAHPIC